MDTRIPTVAYVIVTFRSERLLAACLDAIEADRAGRGWPILVIDNASPDDSARVACDHRSHPIVVEAGRNGGYGAGCNLGAAEVETDAVFFVNPDARLAPGTTDALLGELADPRVAAAGPSSIDPMTMHAEAAGREPTLRSTIGHFLLLGRLPGVRRWFPALQVPAGSLRTPSDVDWVGGAALLVRRQPFDTIGGFDESIFLYMEDVDLCRRLREHGWRIRFVPQLRVTHEMGGSQTDGQPETWYAAFDVYLRRTHGAGAARLAAAAAAVGMLARSAVYLALPGHRRQAWRMALGARAAARRVR